MDFYYPREGLFTYEFEKSLSQKDVQEKFEKLLEERKKNIDQAVVRIKKMQDSISSFVEEKNKRQSKCQQKVNSYRHEMNNALSRAASQKERSQIEDKYKNLIIQEEKNYSSYARQVENKLDSIGKMYELEKSRVRNITYADADKQNSFVQEIVKDIESAVKEAAFQSRTSVVFNAQILRASNIENQKKSVQAWRDIFKESQYQRFGTTSLNSAAHFLPDNVKYKSRIAQYTQYSKKFKNQPLFNNVFLLGGTDLTPAVIEIIHKRKGYSDKKIKQILQAYHDITK
jgi:hypothetical protein